MVALGDFAFRLLLATFCIPNSAFPSNPPLRNLYFGGDAARLGLESKMHVIESNRDEIGYLSNQRW